jgi:Ca-activated chloride channel family protein
MNAHLSLTSAVTLTPRRAGLRAGQDNTVEVLVRIQAPDTPPGHSAERPPQALALVIDRSGSMEGHPLEEAKRCGGYVVSQMRATDSVSLVQFDNRIQRLWPAVPVGDGAALRTAIGAIHAGGNTDLHGGWLEGAQTLVDVAGTGLKRVVLLSDGGANAGLTDPTEIAARCAAWAARGITTSTYGLGRHFNEALMVAMARAGGGNHYYGDTAEDLMDPFQQELELLGNLCLRELQLSASAPDGVVVELVNDLPASDSGWRLPDLPWGAETWAMLKLSVPVGALPPLGRLLSVLRVSVTGRSLEGDEVALERAGLALPVMSPGEYDGLVDDETVSRRLVELAAAEALSRVRTAALAGDWATVDKLLEEASQRFGGNEWVAAVLEAMKEIAAGRERERMLKESMYSSGKLRSRLMAKDEELNFSVACESIDKPSYLRRKPSQGKGQT